MIVNHTITASNTPSALSWQPTTVFQTTLISGVLLTLLSYQATSVFFDLLLGLKPRNQSRAPYLHSLLLTDESSPLSILAAILRLDSLDQLRFNLPQKTTFTRVRSSISKQTLIRLLLLLAIAPIANIVAVVCAIETDKTTTFAEAGVKLALGVGTNFVREHAYVTGPFDADAACARLEDSFKGDATAQFYRCQAITTYRPLFRRATESNLRLTASFQGDVRVEIFIKGANVSAVMNRHIAVSTNFQTFRLAHALNDETASTLANFIAEAVDLNCDSPDFITDAKSGIPPSAESSSSPPSQRQATPELDVPEVVVNVPLKCETVQPDGRVGTSMIAFAIFRLGQRLTLVDVDNFFLADVRSIRRDVTIPATWIRGDDLPMIFTRSPIGPTLWIAIIVAAVVLIRVMTELFTSNDVADGVEAIVASGLGFQSGYELLRCDRDIRYDRKLQRGENSHYGAARPGWEEVDEFQRSVGVLWDDEESYYEGRFEGKFGVDVDDSGDMSTATTYEENVEGKLDDDSRDLT